MAHKEKAGKHKMASHEILWKILTLRLTYDTHTYSYVCVCVW